MTLNIAVSIKQDASPTGPEIIVPAMLGSIPKKQFELLVSLP